MLDRRVLISLVLLGLILIGLDLGAGIRLPKLAPIGIYLVLYAIVSAALAGSRFRSSRSPEADQDGGSPARAPAALGTEGRSVPVEAWPTSGPIGRFGQRGLVLVFQLTGILALLNPFQLIEIVRQGLGNLRIRQRIAGNLPLPSTWTSGVRYSLPLGPPGNEQLSWFVYNGGVSEADSHSWQVFTQRFAYDFVVVDEGLRRHQTRGTKVDDYFCHGLEIIAAADGTVTEIEQAIGTAPLVGWGVADFAARGFRGNFVVLQHAEDEYGVYAHLVPGSVTVSEGEKVRRGQPIGRCGHTGHSSEPHLHFHLQDRADFFTAAGLPVRFHNLLVDGESLESAWLRLGQRVAHLPRASTER